MIGKPFEQHKGNDLMDYPDSLPFALPETQPKLKATTPTNLPTTAQRQIPVAYVSGPYRDTRGVYYVEQNIREAEAVAVELWRIGYAVICPHTNTKHMDGFCPDSADVFIRGDLEIVRRVDVCIMMPLWHKSVGARNEMNSAYYADVLVLNWRLHRHLIDTIGSEGRSAIERIKTDLARSN